MESPSKVNAASVILPESSVVSPSNFVSVGSKTSEELKLEDVKDNKDLEKPASPKDTSLADPSAIMTANIASGTSPVHVFETDKTKETAAKDETDLAPSKTEDLAELISAHFEASLHLGADAANSPSPASTEKLSETVFANDADKLSIQPSANPKCDPSPTDTPNNAAWKDAMRSVKNRIQPGRLLGKPQVQHTSVSEFRPSKCINAKKCEADSSTNPEPITLPCVAELGFPPNIVMVCSDQVRYRCHRIMLVEASPLFADLLINSPETIHIITMGSAAVGVLLDYIYTGALNQLADYAFDLLPAAHIYGMVRLKLMVERMLCTQITRNNAVQLMIESDLYSAEMLML